MRLEYRRVYLAALSAGLATVPKANAQNAPSCTAAGLDGATFGRLLNQRLSSLVSPESEGIPSTYLAVNIKDAQTTVSTAIVSGTGIVVSVSASGGINDGALAIFSDATLAGKFGGAAQVHLLSDAKQQLEYDALSCTAMDAAVRLAEARYRLRVADIRNRQADVQRRVDSTAIHTARRRIEARLDDLRVTEERRKLSAEEGLTLDSLKVELGRLNAREKSLFELPRADSTSDLRDLLAAGNERIRALAEATKLIEVKGYRFSWWSFGVSMENNSFSLFDRAKEPGDQVRKQAHLARFVSLSHSHIRSSAANFRTLYFALGARIGWENNLSTLKKVELRDRQQVAPPPDERVVERSTTAFEGTYRDDVESIRLSADLYKFFVANDRLAYHVFPSYTATTGRIGQVNLGIGLLLAARNATKKTSVANAEVFLNAPDLADVGRSDKSALRRSVLGIRVVFPFSFSLGN